MNKTAVFFFLIGALLLVGCTQQANSDSQTTVLEDGTMVKPDGTMIKPDGTMIKPDGTMVKPDGTMVKPDGTIVNPDGTMIEPDNSTANSDSNPTPAPIAGAESIYEPFSQAAFEAARDSEKKIFLNFYANWCPICKAAEPKVVDAFSQCNNSEIVGFRVNYNDNQTDSDELALAQAHNVTYQHTYVYLEADGQTVLFKQLGANWSASELASQLSCA